MNAFQLDTIFYIARSQIFRKPKWLYETHELTNLTRTNTRKPPYLMALSLLPLPTIENRLQPHIYDPFSVYAVHLH